VALHVTERRQHSSKVLQGIAAFILISAAIQSHASDWGCKVLMCLANPNGSEAVSECVPPMQQLWAALHKTPPDPFPSCDMAGASYARQGISYYDPCPSGSTALDAGAYAIQATSGVTPVSWSPDLSQNSAQVSAQIVYTGIGSGDGFTPRVSSDAVTPLPSKICVGAQTGTTWTQVTDSDGNTTLQMVAMYDQVAVLSPAGSPRIIDVFIDHQLFRRVRW
jgi:hypothetical protein